MVSLQQRVEEIEPSATACDERRNALTTDASVAEVAATDLRAETPSAFAMANAALFAAYMRVAQEAYVYYIPTVLYWDILYWYTICRGVRILYRVMNTNGTLNEGRLLVVSCFVQK